MPCDYSESICEEVCKPIENQILHFQDILIFPADPNRGNPLKDLQNTQPEISGLKAQKVVRCLPEIAPQKPFGILF
ncbi:hypothetical protein L596_019531 [Steinernema carpocapsae]|uniref:Uncharacterized protein n=1 Tax=Steinernema carpocapsae TaxID=34508 RepID=A0A4U5MQS6_STECR|nr:hypothetical protein L596_019531 [Steinernema carpocapsae]